MHIDSTSKINKNLSGIQIYRYLFKNSKYLLYERIKILFPGNKVAPDAFSSGAIPGYQDFSLSTA
jgi:hypothetical protein